MYSTRVCKIELLRSESVQFRQDENYIEYRRCLGYLGLKCDYVSQVTAMIRTPTWALI